MDDPDVFVMSLFTELCPLVDVCVCVSVQSLYVYTCTCKMWIG